jgi:signal transduction histidine kinase
LRHARQDEQRRIAGVLHRGIAQTLTALRLQLSVWEIQLKEDTQAQQGLSELCPLVEQSLTELQDLIASLRPAVPEDVGLPAALRSLVSFISTSTGKDIRLHIDEPFPSLLLPIESTLYQTIKDMLLLTAEQRAVLTPLAIRLELHTSALQLRIQGWARGRGAGASLSGESAVLSRIQEQAEAIGGTYVMPSDEDQPLAIVITLPLLVRNG